MFFIHAITLHLFDRFKSNSPIMKKKEMKDTWRNISDDLGSSRIPIEKAKTVRLDTESQVCNC